MNRPLFGAPAVISRWKPKSARRLQSVSWTFDTCAGHAGWKRSARLHTNSNLARNHDIHPACDDQGVHVPAEAGTNRERYTSSCVIRGHASTLGPSRSSVDSRDPRGQSLPARRRGDPRTRPGDRTLRISADPHFLRRRPEHQEKTGDGGAAVSHTRVTDAAYDLARLPTDALIVDAAPKLGHTP